ncbi:MAG: hypothetical protein ACK5M3_06500 [Dysgonomonas sp.]
MYKKILGKKNIKSGRICFIVVPITLISAISCSVGSIGGGSKVMTKDLFMQSKYANIELPYQESEGGGAMISEEVTFTNPDNWSDSLSQDISKPRSLNEVQHLSEVVVTAKSRFTPEHEGKVNIDFVLRVPKQVLSSKWRVTLSPKLLHNDSIIPLKDVVLKGQDFYDMQKKDYKAYDDYLNSIVEKTDYDSVFLDKKGIDKDIRNRQDFYYKEYFSDWKAQKTYEDKIAKWEAKQKELVLKQNAYKKRLFHEYARKALDEKIKKFTQGKDTTGIYERHMRQYNKKVKKMPIYWDKRYEAHQLEAPKLKNDAKQLGGISNQVITKKDSVEISKHRYFFNDIAQNEMKAELKDEVFPTMVPFPYEKDVQLDSIVTASRDVVYYYKYRYPVTPGLKRLRLTMEGRVDAIDKSTYTMGDIDTISYFISSLSQLADTSLVYKTTKLHRDVYNRMTAYVKFPNKKSTLDVDYKDNKTQLKSILDTYYAFTKDRIYGLDSAVVQVSSSLDGSFEDNASLSEKRSIEIKNYIKRSLGGEIDVDRVFKTEHISEDWNTLVKEIQKRSDLKNKTAILDMLSNAINPDATEDDIKRLYKADYTIIRDSIYPLLEKVDVEFNMHRTDMSEQTEVRKEYRDGYEEGLRLLLEREYWKAMDILANYPDYNAALCLTCLGYNAKAYDLLKGLPKTANNEYLLAILAERLNKGEDAAEHLMESFRLDSSKIYRAPLDPEVTAIMKKYNLNSRMASVKED